jgi:hypothetical protein
MVGALILSFSFLDEADTYMYYAVRLSYRRKEEHGGKLSMNCGKSEIDGEAWLLNDPYNVEVLNKEKCYSFRHYHELCRVGS